MVLRLVHYERKSQNNRHRLQRRQDIRIVPGRAQVVPVERTVREKPSQARRVRQIFHQDLPVVLSVIFHLGIPVGHHADRPQQWSDHQEIANRQEQHTSDQRFQPEISRPDGHVQQVLSRVLPDGKYHVRVLRIRSVDVRSFPVRSAQTVVYSFRNRVMRVREFENQRRRKWP